MCMYVCIHLSMYDMCVCVVCTHMREGKGAHESMEANEDLSCPALPRSILPRDRDSH